jgi:hypothetical protein
MPGVVSRRRKVSTEGEYVVFRVRERGRRRVVPICVNRCGINIAWEVGRSKGKGTHFKLQARGRVMLQLEEEVSSASTIASGQLGGYYEICGGVDWCLRKRGRKGDQISSPVSKKGRRTHRKRMLQDKLLRLDSLKSLPRRQRQILLRFTR